VELAIPRGRLEADGIECRVLDELTVQVNPFFSNAIGGVKLQVKEGDIQKAVAILIDGGYMKKEDLQSLKSQTSLDNVSSKLPILEKLLRLIAIIAIATVITSTAVYFATRPSVSERLTQQSWCLDYIIYEDETYIPYTEKHLHISMSGYCQENIELKTDGTIMLPGFNSHAVSGVWTLEGKLLQISLVDTFDFVYNGFYTIDFSGKELILQSDQTTLFCFPQKNY
jgi:hypothetical protein